MNSEGEDGKLSDLANSCEYLSIDKLCSAVSESEKAKASRQVRCQNEEKTTCCYICQSRSECAMRCKFLGNLENESSQIEPEQTEAKNMSTADEKTEIDQIEKAPVACSSCYVEMSQTRTRFKINGWEGPPPKLAGDNSGKEFEELPVIVYLCPKCGKIEFKACP